MEFVLLAPFGIALAAPLIHRVARDRAGLVLALLPAALFLYFLSQAPRIGDGRPLSVSHDWVPTLNVSFSLYLDGLSLLFALLITGIGALVLIYAGGYLAGHRDLGRFYAFLLLFMGSMLGLVLADNMFLMFVFWEMTSISSYLLIAFEHEDEDSRTGALQALLVTNAGGMAMLAGLVLLSQVGGTQQLSAISGAADAVRNDGLYLPILLLVLAGGFTKSAQVPFHFWLPGAMAAPTPVSAYLHSATMVKAGIYLLARLAPTLGGTDEWNVLLTSFGAVTMVTGGVLAFYQTDLKRILAYSTISALGTLVLLLGLDTPEATTDAMVFLLAHALYKAALFMTAGAIDHETGTRDVTQLSGLRKVMPRTAFVAALAALSLAGFGPLLSFIGKELLLEAALNAEHFAALLVAAVVAAGALFVLVAGLVGVRPFAGETVVAPRQPHDAPASLLLGPAILGVLGVVFGVFPRVLESDLLSPAVSAILGRSEVVHLELWHGVNLAFLLSVLSVAAGILLYFGWELRRTARLAVPLADWSPSRLFERSLKGLVALARWQTRLVQNGYLRAYLFVTFLATFGLAGYTLLTKAGLERAGSFDDVRFYHVIVGAVMLVAAWSAAAVGSRLVAVALLGVVGYGVSLIYVLFGAPDLAMTQFMIETLTVLLFLAAFYHLPTTRRVSSLVARGRDALIAIGSGAFMTALVLVASAHRGDSPTARFFAEESVPGGHGRNIVNVILVDFRALDTLGEITVLAVAAFAVYGLLRMVPSEGPEEEEDLEGQASGSDYIPALEWQPRIRQAEGDES